VISSDNRKIVFGGVSIIVFLLAFTLFSERGLLKARDLAQERDTIIARMGLLWRLRTREACQLVQYGLF